jgi:hypothetical protein
VPGRFSTLIYRLHAPSDTITCKNCGGDVVIGSLGVPTGILLRADEVIE